MVKVVAVKMDEEILDVLDRLARKMNRSRSDLIREGIMAVIFKYKSILKR